MDKRKSLLNVSVSIGFKLITMMMVIVVKRFLIQTCGNEVNGLNALYLSIIGFLSVAELGVGGAITFCMYKPIVEGDNDTVSALYHLFRRLYCIIGGSIFTVGLILTPFIKVFAKDYQQLDVNLYFTFFLMLISVETTYLFSAKTSLINAYKNNYITTAISSAGIIIQYILQIIVLLITKSFACYLICRSIAVLIQWIATEIITKRNYSAIVSNKAKLNADTKREVGKNIKAMFMHKIGSVLVNTVDSVIISMFVGVVALGEYSNYSTILASLTGVLKLVFTSLTSVLGHFYVRANKETVLRYSEAFHLFNYALGTVFYLGYYAVIDNLIGILFSVDLIVSKSISFVITLNGFVHFLRQSTLAFREATGTFYNDRWKPLFEGCANIVLSILFVQWMGVPGVIVATIFTNLLICHVVEPYVLYKNAFMTSPKKFYMKNYSMIGLFVIALALLHYCMRTLESQWTEFWVNGLISLGISVGVCGIVLLFNRDLCKHLLKNIKGWMTK